MRRDDYLKDPVGKIRVNAALSVDQLIRQFGNSGSFGAGRLASACEIYEKMLRDKDCTVFLALSGAVVPAGLRSVVVDLIRKKLIDVVVCTGASLVHDAIEAVGGRHYKGSWVDDDSELYKYHIFRIYDVLVPEEAFVRLDYELSKMYDEIALDRKGESLSSREFAWELGKRLRDPDSILRSAYEMDVPIFIPAVRDSEFGFIHWLHSSQKDVKNVLSVDAFKEVSELCGICAKSPKNGMIVLGGGVPRNAVQSAALASKKGLDYAVVVTMDRPEMGGLSGSTLKETISWGKVKGEADNVMVIGDVMVVFPLMVASVVERLGTDFARDSFGSRVGWGF
jgi:deoxyhypusine synthase